MYKPGAPIPADTGKPEVTNLLLGSHEQMKSTFKHLYGLADKGMDVAKGIEWLDKLGPITGNKFATVI